MIEAIKIYTNSSSTKGSVVAIGNFNGVHLGHQSLIEIIRRRARIQGEIGVLVFELTQGSFLINKNKTLN